MKLIPALIILVFAFGGVTFAQPPIEAYLKQARQIRPLESNRDEVRRLLAEFSLDDSDAQTDEFSNEYLEIDVSYASGQCGEQSEDEDTDGIWNAPEWSVVKVEVSFSNEISLEELGINVDGYTKERRYRGDDDSFVFHNKARGMAIKTDDNEVSRVIFFPPTGQSKRLCERSSGQKAFYSRKTWFGKEKPYDDVCNWVNQFANVTDMELGSTEIEPLASKRIAVLTTAVDPENDVLTYSYTVSAGTVMGTGAKVTWDLSGVKAGEYTMTVGVDDGAGILGKTVTKTVVVK